MGNSSQNAKDTSIPVMDSNAIRITSSYEIYSHEAASMGMGSRKTKPLGLTRHGARLTQETKG